MSLPLRRPARSLAVPPLKSLLNSLLRRSIRPPCSANLAGCAVSAGSVVDRSAVPERGVKRGMCGRITLTRSGDEIAAFFALEMAAAEQGGETLQARFNIAPSQKVLTVVQNPSQSSQAAADRAAQWKRWGLVPSWSKDPQRGGSLFNARSETVDVKPSFRSAWKRRRCLVIADGFYEWSPRNKGHQPYYFSAHGGTLLAMAGLYEEWVDGGAAAKETHRHFNPDVDSGTSSAPVSQSGEIIESCTVLTTEANADLAEVHHRMPVLLQPGAFDAWLDPGTDPETLKRLFVPSPEKTLLRRAVSDYVNSPQNDDTACLNPPEPKKPLNKSLEPPAQAELFSDNTTSGEETQ